MVKIKRTTAHPFRSGNYAPVKRELGLTPCSHQGSIPEELRGGQYVRNGGNPMGGSDEEREMHWFDGDGMLSGVLFRALPGGDTQPEFINKYILTDVLLATSSTATRPVLPSIATFSSLDTSLFTIVGQIIRAALLCISTWLPYLYATALEAAQRRLQRISVCNTSVYMHDGKAYAGCESGPPMRVLLPGLETVNWWTGELKDDEETASSDGWGKTGLNSLFAEMTTAHPHVDPTTNELLLFHMSFFAPFLRVSVIPPKEDPSAARLVGVEVPGLTQPKLMHDFAASQTHTVILDLPCSLDPRNLVKNRPMLHYDAGAPVRFGIFPRRQPERVRWYERPESCLIFHTANAWDSPADAQGSGTCVNLLACRLNSAVLLYSAGGLDPPTHALPTAGETDKCQLFYWQFDLDAPPVITRPQRAFALSAIPFEFPTMNEAHSMRAASFVYGSTMRAGGFSAGIGAQSAKVDCIAKIDAAQLIQRGTEMDLQHADTVDQRTVQEILSEQESGTQGDAPAVRIFALPEGVYAGEASFVSRFDAQHEDDGWLVFFTFDENVGLDACGHALPNATSELWILDAREMKDVVCRIQLPQRVTYGLHGHWFSAAEIANQRPVQPEEVRTWALEKAGVAGPGMGNAGKAHLSATQMGDKPDWRHHTACAVRRRLENWLE